jgi:hypothetical protein
MAKITASQLNSFKQRNKPHLKLTFNTPLFNTNTVILKRFGERDIVKQIANYIYSILEPIDCLTETTKQHFAFSGTYEIEQNSFFLLLCSLVRRSNIISKCPSKINSNGIRNLMAGLCLLTKCPITLTRHNIKSLIIFAVSTAFKLIEDEINITSELFLFEQKCKKTAYKNEILFMEMYNYNVMPDLDIFNFINKSLGSIFPAYKDGDCWI